jgi:hypothetical protein
VTCACLHACMQESAPYKVEKGEVWVPDFPKDSPPPVPWPVPGHPEQNSRRAAAVLNALPDLNIPVDDTNPATVRLVYIKYGNSSDWEPVPAANTRLAKDIKATRVSTSWPTSALEVGGKVYPCDFWAAAGLRSCLTRSFLLGPTWPHL